MTAGSVESDKSLGLGLVLSAVALVGVAAMLAAPAQLAKASGFALAMVAAILAVGAIHLFD
ncbi:MULTISPECIES: DUF7525 family protein [unclassified Haloparvum]|uniref:DUF7525 family protein n=1 Tax=Haloparvum sp. PAK95 TaxID=3418962 RepID=UPI003D2EB760